MNKNNMVLLHLSLINGIGPALVLKFIKNLFDDFVKKQRHPGIHDLEFDLFQVYNLRQSDFINIYGFTQKQAGIIYSGLRDKEPFDKELDLINKYQINLLTFLDAEYPEILKSIYLPPIVLYTKGEKLSSYDKKLSIVGARKSTNYSEQVLDLIVPEIVKNNISIVSGGALGVDTFAHKKAIESGGKTIVILGSGLLKPYPKENIKFFKKISNGYGTLVSPFKLNSEPDRGNFPARNRIIAGMSFGCLVVEAAQKSGALITAQFALDEGRSVFAIPGDIFSPMSLGTNNLIKQGAKLVLNTNDILEEYGINVISEEKKISVKANISTAKSEEFKDSFLENFTYATSIDDLSAKLNLDIFTLQEKLFDLELEGKVKQNLAGYWEKL
ncbi:DNA-processing protein DprA [Candidatus Dependentiae bacterium]|nr:DNA-processing protein DprA [Candidatus Dependentiae bacterium]MBU4387021.1 DNA-processing protein DprA [Candidatus Dependentiae bacterium]MCG2756102.1 DNA-processing protein DprA [Candidatus Dependentiae bacterium]